MINFFINIHHKIQKRKTAFFFLILIGLSSCIYIASRISFDEDITNILPKGKKNDITAKVLQQLNFSDKITVMIKAKNQESQAEVANVAQIFLDSLERDSLFYTDIQGKVNADQIDETFSFVHEHLPYFLDKEDYVNIENQLSKDSINKRIKNNYNTLISPTGIVAREFILKDPLGFSFIGLEKLRELGVSKEFIINNGFISTSDSSTLLLFVTPTYPGTDTKMNEGFVDRLYAYQNAINKQFENEAQITFFGSPFIALANARQIKSDIQSTVVFSIAVLMLILILFYKHIFIPIILFIPAICGAAFSLAIVYFINTSISAISISIGAILLGITVDYSLHIITHYRENTDINSLYKSVTKPILTSSITTAVAFLCLLFVNSKVLQDLGVFASISVISSAFFALLIVPHLYKPRTNIKETIIDKFAGHKFEKNKVLLIVTVVAVTFGAFTFTKVRFNDNIADLNYVPENMKKSEIQLESLGSIGAKSIYLSVYSNNTDSLLLLNNQLESKLRKLQVDGVVEDYTSVGRIVLSKENQKEKLQQWNDFWGDSKADSIISRVNQAAMNLGFNKDAFKSLEKLLTKEYPILSIADYESMNTLFLNEFYSSKNDFQTLSTIVKTDGQHRSEAIESLSQDNLVLIDRKHLNEQFLGQIKDDFKSLMNYSFFAVFLILIIFFKRIELAILSIIPIVLTGLVTAGFIYLLDLELNIFSTIVTTLVLGLGIDFSIFMTSGLQHKYTTGENHLKIYRTSILLAVLTTVLSIGVLIFAKHPALKSISLISLIGITAAMFITFSLYPLLFKVFIEKRPQKGKSPISLRLFLTAVISFFYYGAGGVLYSIFGILFMILFPMKRETKQHYYRKVIAMFIKSVMYSNYGLKNKVNNPHNEKFDKPAIIIPNHSSFLDTLSIGFLPTPFIFLVNDWVYKSPIFGKAVQLAGYYPVSLGLEEGEKKLVEMVKKGNSLIIFPEGTRSTTDDIGRFHKGAFLLAQTYNIDIVPLYIHGNSHLLPKGDFIIFDGNHTLEIGERISFENIDKDQNLKELTKSISVKFKDKFKSLRYQLEDEDYFKEKIRLNFLYKEADIVRLAKNEFKENKSLYHVINRHIPENAKVLRIGGDLGIWDLMLTLQQAKRRMLTYIESEELRNVAKQSYLLHKRRINYIGDLSSVSADVMLITTTVEEHELIEILNLNSFKQIIVVSKIDNHSVFLKFGYNMHYKDNNYYILKNT
ncbi:MAG TPA: 1-acyl-sn-glycerol-3-phosphate acyltransferase [Brumimicrobium sp.]|nr:1-acyl-sn-glycerol-3-phosphate acyltransferase [Brumimicrobium sp.]